MSQPSARDIDHFRMAFFQNVIQQEETKEKQRALRQRMCHHRYEPTALLSFQCRLCDHVFSTVRPSTSSFFLGTH